MKKFFGRFGKSKEAEPDSLIVTAEDKIRSEILVTGNIKNGASWFYWIAGLSAINTLVMLFKGDVSFIAGLSFTQFVDYICTYVLYDYYGMAAIIFAIVIDVIFAGIFIYFGIMANKGKRWSFIAGMILYGIDTILFIFLKDYFSLAFHLFALYSIFSGFKSLNKVIKDNREESIEKTEAIIETQLPD